MEELRLDKLVLSNPTSSSSVIRDADLNLALLRASIGTSAENDRALDGLKLKLDNGPLRPIPSGNGKPSKINDSVGSLYSSMLLGAPISLHHVVGWPLDLFMTAPARATYGDIHAYLFALRSTHRRVLETWTSLSATQRRQRSVRGREQSATRRHAGSKATELARSTWGILRLMLFFFDELLGHFMTDIVDVQHRSLLDMLDPPTGAGIGADGLPRSSSMSASLRSSTRFPRSGSVRTFGGYESVRASSPGSTAQESTRHQVPPVPNQHTAYLDFLSLRQMHARHLAFLREGLLLSDRALALLIRDIMDLSTRFAGLIERWGGDVIPSASGEEEPGQQTMEQRLEEVGAVKDVSNAPAGLLGNDQVLTIETVRATLRLLQSVGGESESTISRRNQWRNRRRYGSWHLLFPHSEGNGYDSVLSSRWVPPSQFHRSETRRKWCRWPLRWCQSGCRAKSAQSGG